MATPTDANPDDGQELRDYLAWLCWKLRVIRHADALSGDGTHPIQLQVPTVFVPQRVRRDMPLVSPPRTTPWKATFILTGTWRNGKKPLTPLRSAFYCS